MAWIESAAYLAASVLFILAFKDLEVLCLAGVMVLRRLRPARRPARLDFEQVAAGVGTRAPEGQGLARDRVLEDVARSCHARIMRKAGAGLVAVPQRHT